MINSTVKLLDMTAAAYPENIAVQDGEFLLTYAEYKALGQRLATAILSKLGSGKKNRTIGIFLPKSYKMLASFMGAMYSGNIYVPLDTTMPVSRLEKVFANLEPDCIITDEGLESKLVECGINEERILFFDNMAETEADRAAIDGALEQITDTDPIYIMYTSGSTGTPKGVVIPHRGVIDYANWVCEKFQVNENTIIGNQSPFYFDNTVLDIYASLLSGAKLVIINDVFFQFQAKLPEFLNAEKINFIFWVPTIYINVANSGVLEENKLPYLKKALFCGEVMPNKQLNIWRKTQPHVLYANLYGPTEITDVCTYYIVEDEFEDSDSLPIGIPCENMDVIILNEDEQQAAIGETGELCVLGIGLALGYYKEKELTDKAFMQNPLNKKYQERMYRTGDLAYVSEENLIMYVGRKDSQIKHRGNRIELGEIETAARSLEGVKNACVLYDNEEGQIVMFLEAAEEISMKGIKKNMLALVPKYMLPGRIEVMKEFPYTANKKIDRVRLRKEWIEERE
ncbi:amino acid adenylation domain-containing protein [Tyzzerella sp. OttesenSCG-928-J15]|nr:amino acid adenylation domain-containing protein [Tyzzerella sp. OttesenSCG-928-J15]